MSLRHVAGAVIAVSLAWVSPALAADDPAFVDSQPLAWQSARWYHVAVTRNAGVVSFYRDGAAAGSATLAAPLAPDGDLPLEIGAAPIAGSVFNPIKGRPRRDRSSSRRGRCR
jgi:hypothetical protein